MTRFWRVTKNKTLELQFEQWEKHWNWFKISTEWTRKCDHAGFQFNFEVMGLYFHIWFCDNRHWPYEV